MRRNTDLGTKNASLEKKRIQDKINWISGQIRETKIQLNRQFRELEAALKEQEKLRKTKSN